jgi:hypothetical protein
MSILITNSNITYGQSATIILQDLTNIVVTPMNSVASIVYNVNGIVITVVPTISTLYNIYGVDTLSNIVEFNETIYVLPIVLAQTTNNSTVVPYGNPVTLIAYGGISYLWYPETYLNTTTESTVICTPLGEITYTVQVKDPYNNINITYITISIVKELIFSPSQPTVYKSNLLKVSVNDISTNVDNSLITYTWTPTTSKYLPEYCANIKYGSSITLHPEKNLEFIVDAYDSNNTILISSNLKIKVIEKPMNILDFDILPYRLSTYILERNLIKLREELIKDVVLSQKIINFYYTTLQTAYRMEWTNKNGIPFKIKWLNNYQIYNDISEMVISFKQQWNFFKYINNNQTRQNYTISNFAFLLNTVNTIYLETPQQIYLIQENR